VAAGLLAGLTLTLIFDKAAESWVTESSRDPAILGGVTVLLIAVAGLACLAPARLAASVDPVEALRYE
jgi:ABC-type antimicrobial peptide transport system permease subunit